jgi:hypothetical protein
LLIVERLLSLPQAAALLLDDVVVQAHWESEVSALGARVSLRSLGTLAVVFLFILVAVICAAVAIKSGSNRFMLGSALTLGSAFLVMAMWRIAPHQTSLSPLLGKPAELPARIRVFQAALATGKIEAGGGVDPSVFAGAFWPLLFSRTKAHRRHVRASDGHRELDLLTVDGDTFDAWRRGHGWMEIPKDEQTPAPANERSVDQKTKARKKSLWILEMRHTQMSLDQRLHKLIPPNSDLAKEMARTAMSSALSYIIANGETCRVVDAIAVAETSLMKKYGHTGKTPGNDSIKWIEAMLSDPPRWLKAGLGENSNQHKLPL